MKLESEEIDHYKVRAFENFLSLICLIKTTCQRKKIIYRVPSIQNPWNIQKHFVINFYKEVLGSLSFKCETGKRIDLG